MFQLSKERILEWQKIFKEKWSVEYTFAEAEEAASNLIGLFDLLLKIDRRNKENLKRLKDKNNQTKKPIAGLFVWINFI